MHSDSEAAKQFAKPHPPVCVCVWVLFVPFKQQLGNVPGPPGTNLSQHSSPLLELADLFHTPFLSIVFTFEKLELFFFAQNLMLWDFTRLLERPLEKSLHERRLFTPSTPFQSVVRSIQTIPFLHPVKVN